MTHICVGKIIINGSDNDLSPWRRPAIIWTNAGILLIGPLGKTSVKFRNSNIFIQENPFENVVWKMAAILFRPQCVKRVRCCSIRHGVFVWLKNNGINNPLFNTIARHIKIGIGNCTFMYFDGFHLITAFDAELNISPSLILVKITEIYLHWHWLPD